MRLKVLRLLPRSGRQTGRGADPTPISFPKSLVSASNSCWERASGAVEFSSASANAACGGFYRSGGCLHSLPPRSPAATRQALSANMRVISLRFPVCSRIALSPGKRVGNAVSTSTTSWGRPLGLDGKVEALVFRMQQELEAPSWVLEKVVARTNQIYAIRLQAHAWSIFM